MKIPKYFCFLLTVYLTGCASPAHKGMLTELNRLCHEQSKVEVFHEVMVPLSEFSTQGFLKKQPVGYGSRFFSEKVYTGSFEATITKSVVEIFRISDGLLMGRDTDFIGYGGEVIHSERRMSGCETRKTLENYIFKGNN